MLIYIFQVFVAGGSVLGSSFCITLVTDLLLACMLPTPLIDLREFYHLYSYRNSDVDLFIYGLTAAEANEKLKEIYRDVVSCTKGKVTAFRTLHTITLVSEFPRRQDIICIGDLISVRHIQIILRLYKSPAEILCGFDIDCCAVGFDGIKVWVHPRAARAIKYQMNLVDLSRRSPSYGIPRLNHSNFSLRASSVQVQQARILCGRSWF